MQTVVYQSHRDPPDAPWVRDCTASVRQWAEHRGFDYHWLGDELFDLLPEKLWAKVALRTPIAADLARLRLLQHGLESAYERAIWIDADVLILRPATWRLGNHSHGFGREVWIQHADRGLKTYRKIHNAVMLFCRQDPVLGFYQKFAERIVDRHRGSAFAPQIVGPKLLSALHNIVGFDVIEEAGMLAPLVARSILQGDGDALRAFNRNSAAPPQALNLCSSLLSEHKALGIDMHAVIARLLDSDQAPLFRLPGTSHT